MKNNPFLKYLTTLPNLLEIQRSSFCWFMSEGLPEQLAKFSSIIDYSETFELKLYSQEYELKRPKINPSQVKDSYHSYNLKIFFPVELLGIEEIEDPLNELQIFNKKIVILKKTKKLVGEIPLMTNKATFLVNGCERVVVNQLVRSPGVYFRRKAAKGIFDYSATIIPNQGSWLTFDLKGKKSLLYLKIDKKYEIPINWVLRALDVTDENIYKNMRNINTLQKFIKNMKNEIVKQRENYRTKNNLEKLTPEETANQESSAIKKVKNLIYQKILTSKNYDLGKIGRLKMNQKLKLNISLSEKNLNSYDLLRIIDYLIDVYLNNARVDDIDSLKNRRIRSAGELLQLQVRIAFIRLKKTFSEKLATYDLPYITYNTILSPGFLTNTLKDFFCSSQLAQFMDETNPLSEVTHKRRVSALGPGGLNSDHVTFAARDIHPTQYGRLCPIETPEGPNAGLNTALAIFVKINKYGFLKTPFFQLKKGRMKKEIPIYLTAEEEDSYKIASADIDIYHLKYKQGELIPVRYKQEFLLVKLNEIDLIAISPIQLFSIGTSLIPFLEHDDANRVLMGSNMQRQAVPLLYPNKPIIGTGLEKQIPFDSGVLVINSKEGTIINIIGNQIIVETILDRDIKDIERIFGYSKYHYTNYFLQKYRRSNQDTCINNKPIVWLGQFVQRGQVLADGPATDSGELAVGQNLTIAYLPWEGYNYEDALILSDRLVYENLFTSIHIEKHETQLQSDETGQEKLAREIPNVDPSYLKYLDKYGVISKGTFVQPGDILVGKVIPTNESESELTPELRLLRAIFYGDKTDELPKIRDSSFRLPNGSSGRVIETVIYSKRDRNLFSFKRKLFITIFIAELRRVKIGDKISGRHGNKGIVSKILPIQDMPYLPDGTIVDIILNPLGVPSRMNVGQIFECLLGLAATYLNCRFKILPFDEFYGIETSRILINNKLKEAAKLKNKPWLFNSYSPGKVNLTDGRTGEIFDNQILIGKAYILKLIHLVDDKIHARSTGNYSLITQQPLRGRSLGGGQRFGEMEVWALEAFGAAYTLQELLTIKSDDMDGRNKLLTAIVKGEHLPKPDIPESLRVLLRELNCLGLDITTHRIDRSDDDDNESNEFGIIKVDLFKSPAQLDFEKSNKLKQIEKDSLSEKMDQSKTRKNFQIKKTKIENSKNQKYQNDFEFTSKIKKSKKKTVTRQKLKK